jgi:hypothetical protein
MKDRKAGILAYLWVKLIFIARVLGAAWCRPGAPENKIEAIKSDLYCFCFL